MIHMGDEDKIANMKEIEDRVKIIIEQSIEVLEGHLKVDDGLKACPMCHKEFDPVEVGIDVRTLPPNISEHLYNGIMEAFKDVQIKYPEPNKDNQKTIESAMKAIAAIKKLRLIIEAFGRSFKKGSDNSALMYNVITDINEVVKKPLE